MYEKFYIPKLLARIIAGEKFMPLNVDIWDIKDKPKATILYAEVKRNLEVEDDKPTYSNTSGIAEIMVNATAPEDKVDEIRLFHNGKAVNLATRGLFVTEADGTDSKKYTINLLPGANNFRAIALNSQRTESEPDEILINYQTGNTPAPKPGSTNGTVIDAVDKNATMYIVVVGVNAYKGKIKPLGYAVPDATAFREELEKDARSVIGNVKSYFITDAKADKTGIVNAFNDIKKNAKPQDVFVFYYAGHGYIHPGNKEFYLVSADVEDGNESLLKNGVAAKELQSFAVEIAAQK
ncbi:MAG: caspase family protein [Sphingobacteriales bacterium]|nr:caspase family protein [Sphingobacteriales bacterium]